MTAILTRCVGFSSNIRHVACPVCLKNTGVESSLISSAADNFRRFNFALGAITENLSGTRLLQQVYNFLIFLRPGDAQDGTAVALARIHISPLLDQYLYYIAMPGPNRFH